MKKRIITLTIVIATAICSYTLGTHNGREGYVKLEECIPLEDVACWYIDGYDYPSFELKDVTHQLDNFDNANYEDIFAKVKNANEEYYNNYIDMRTVIDFNATENGLQLYTNDGNGYYWER